MKNNGSKFLVALVAVVFAFFAIFTPTLFAQQKKSKIDVVKASQNMYLISSIYGMILENYVDEVDPRVLYEGALKGMMDSLGDPYTTYLDTEMMRSLSDTTNGNFGGVGISITKPIFSTPEKPAYVEVMSPIEGGPGYKVGIQAGDYIVSIEGKQTVEMTMNEVLGLLRGKVGEKVSIVVKRGSIELPFTLVREIIEVPTVKYGMIDKRQDPKKKIGYIKIIEFTPLTAERVQDGLNFCEKNGYEALIIDLRNNPGGLITSVGDVADKFIDGGVIVSTKSRNSEAESVIMAEKAKTTVKKGLPIVVLINKGSASASEILSGALKDYKLAYLMGERSYGKGSVQQVIPLNNNDGVKLTMARYYTPSDVNIDKIGIPPDREVKLDSFTEEEEKAYLALVNDDAIVKYVKENPKMTKDEIASFATELSKKYALSEKLLRRLVRLEVNRTKEPELYDLDYDDQLNAAIKLLEEEDFENLMKNTKTLKQLQDEAKLADKSAEAEKTKKAEKPEKPVEKKK